MPHFQLWFPFTRYSTWGAARNGAKDGRHGIPEENQEKQPAYILQLKQVGEENIERICQKWKNNDGVLLADYCKAKSSLEELHKALARAQQEAQEAKTAEEQARQEYVKHLHMK